jgi:hypothetical protein
LSCAWAEFELNAIGAISTIKLATWIATLEKFTQSPLKTKPKRLELKASFVASGWRSLLGAFGRCFCVALSRFEIGRYK